MSLTESINAISAKNHVVKVKDILEGEDIEIATEFDHYNTAENGKAVKTPIATSWDLGAESDVKRDRLNHMFQLVKEELLGHLRESGKSILGVQQEFVVFDDPTLRKQRREGVYGWCEVVFLGEKCVS